MALTAAGKKHARVLFIGRFQPFHKGHEKILAYLLLRYSNVTIAIGSAQEKRTKENPFSAAERKGMIRRVSLAHSGWWRKIRFAFIADSPSNAKWVQAVLARFPPSIFAVASANPLVRRLLEPSGYSLDPSPLFRRAEWEGRKIRKKMRGRAPASFEKDIPPSLREWMKKNGLKIIGRAKN